MRLDWEHVGLVVVTFAITWIVSYLWMHKRVSDGVMRMRDYVLYGSDGDYDRDQRQLMGSVVLILHQHLNDAIRFWRRPPRPPHFR